MKISIITVTYNCVDFVQYCIDSVSSQHYPLVEHIVIDGASTDGTTELLRSGKLDSSRVISEPDGGIYDAMNKGISLASGDVVGFLNGDDYYAHGWVLNSVAALFSANPDLDACYADLVYVKRQAPAQVVRYWESGSFVPGSFSKGWCPPHPTFFVRRTLLERFGGFDLDFLLAADVELMIRLLETHRLRVKYVPNVWVKMRLGGVTNMSAKNVLHQNAEVLRALGRHGLPVNLIRFAVGKLRLRAMQFVRRPPGS